MLILGLIGLAINVFGSRSTDNGWLSQFFCLGISLVLFFFGAAYLWIWYSRKKNPLTVSTKPVKVEDFYDSREVPVVLGNVIFNRMGENVEFCDQKGMDLYQKTKEVPHLFSATGETTSASRDAYRCQPSLKLTTDCPIP